MRNALGVPLHDPLCPCKLAGYLDYRLAKLSDFAVAQPEAVAYLRSKQGQREFSAITLNSNGMSLIVHNDAHHPGRQAANIAHELAHGLLCHPPAPLISANGARTFNREHEDEANWLGPALLISEEAAISIAQKGRPLHSVCKHYGVSLELLQMRLRVTGAIIRVARRKG
jgi:Zn-dependent peptidase ImmA (M78 family)